jgi:hypothetical protein
MKKIECMKCHKTKPENEFPADYETFGNMCKDCMRIAANNRRMRQDAEAKAYCDDLYLGQEIDDFILNSYLGEEIGDFTLNRINIEDRLSGEVYQKTKVFMPESGEFYEIEDESVLRYTAKEMENRGVKFV